MQSNGSVRYNQYTNSELTHAFKRLLDRCATAMEIGHTAYADWLRQAAVEILVELATRYQEELDRTRSSPTAPPAAKKSTQQSMNAA